MRTSIRGTLATVVVASSMLALGQPAALADPPTPRPPSQAQVDAAKKAAAAKAADVATLQAQLVVAKVRLDNAARQAEIAAEAYNGAVWRLGEATRASKAAAATSRDADAAVEGERAGIAQLVTQSAQDGTVLSNVTAYLGGEDLTGIMDRVGVVRSAGDSMKVKYDQYRYDAAKADLAAKEARRARKAVAGLAKAAEALRDDAIAAANLAASQAAGLASQRKTLIEELAAAQKISVRLATRRFRSLEKVAHQKAAAAAAAQAAAQAKDAAVQAKKDAAKAKKDAAHQEAAAKGTDKVLQDLSEEGGWDLPGLPVPAGTSDGARKAIEFARQQLGEEYVWAAAGPDQWDCSGLTMMAWREGGIALPHYSAAQYQQTKHISAAELQAGDLVFWGSSPNTIHHVALYIGSGQIIHAPRTGVPVKVSGLYDWDPPNYFGRP